MLDARKVFAGSLHASEYGLGNQEHAILSKPGLSGQVLLKKRKDGYFWVPTCDPLLWTKLGGGGCWKPKQDF